MLPRSAFKSQSLSPINNMQAGPSRLGLNLLTKRGLSHSTPSIQRFTLTKVNQSSNGRLSITHLPRLTSYYSSRAVSSISRRLSTSANSAPIPLNSNANSSHPSLSFPPSQSSTNPDFNTNTNPNPNPNSNPKPEPDPEPEPSGAYAKFKALSKKYGWYAIIMYFLLSTVDFSLCFLTVHSIGAEKIEPLLNAGVHQYRLIRHGESRTAELEEEDRRHKAQEAEAERKEREIELRDEKKGNPSKMKNGFASRALWAEIALAYAIHKTALLPFRAGLTVAWTPKVVAWLTKRGWVGKVGDFVG